MGKFWLETEAIADANDMREDDIVDEIELTEISTLSKKWKSAITKRFKETASLCSSYEEYSRTLAEEPELSVREDLSGEMAFYVDDLPHNV